MPHNLLKPAVFFAGLAALCWIGAGYVGTSGLALAVVALIAACYVAGGLELLRYRQATSALAHAVERLDGPAPNLADWLQPLPASLRHAVRQRVEGDRVALPAPALTPYLVGLLVLLGMLGTLLGMMTTLRGTGLALASAADLDAIRTSLAAPVQGLAFAFGTSIAGVAASAMLGLLSALCRRERSVAVQTLDAAIATTLRPHSKIHQREQAFELLQRQVDVMPLLVDRLQAAMTAIEQQSVAAHERQAAQQSAFHERTEAVNAQLAASVEQSLKHSVAESARAAGAALQPVVESTMAALANSATLLQENVLQTMQHQLDGLSGRLHDSTTTIAGLWGDALAQQRHSNETVQRALAESLEGFAATFEQRSAQVVDIVATRFDAASDRATAAWGDALSHQSAHGDALAERNQRALTGAVAALESQAASLIGAVHASNAELQARLDAQAHASAGLADAVAMRFEAASERASAVWAEALRTQSAQADTTAERNEQALAAAAATFETHAASLVGAVQASNGEVQTCLDAQTENARQLVDLIAARFESASASATAAWTEALARQASLGDALAERNEQAFASAAGTFETHAASLIGAVQQSHADLQVRLEAQTQAHARATLDEIARLVHDAAEAPKAAAAVIAELRHNLSESMVRDTAVLEERGRLLATVDTLLSSVNHAAAEQRTAVDALISTSADALERVATRFTAQVETQTDKLDNAADRIAAGAIEVASLGDVFGTAVQRFGEANERLVTRLQAIEGALDQSLARSDEQLAYYVAQAREVVDLSVLAQKQIIGELQRVAQARTQAGAETA
ncbi:DUF802 domain-containing protein [Cognatilysobacter bugurensis]|uniref:Chemotaxis protein n=1 Tax=Cognatilysobacter bugurensis TaxID=543356 RepID=A0A918W5T4_9GAMM|nr:DUF802 domain-containing protein [Lysobacter bugurensis]GHA75313.1 chemotaxis protein [Lysobacter bugurensis]